MIWRIALFMGATYALAVSAGEILTDETGERFHSHAVSARTKANAPVVADEAAMTGARPCDRIAHIDQRSHAEYVPGVYVAGKPVVPADAYMSDVPVIRSRGTFGVPLKDKAFRRHVYAGAVQTAVDPATGAVAYGGEPPDPSDMPRLHDACPGREG